MTSPQAGERAARWLAAQLPAMEEALAALVEVNSFTENREGGLRVGALLDELLRIDGLAARVVPSSRFADHRVYTSAGAPGVPPLALIGHLDTVFPPGTFEGYRQDGTLRRGPGVLDMKGGLVVVAFALRALAEEGGLLAAPALRLVVVSDEEVGSPEGAGVIAGAVGGAGAALVFESGRANDAIITRRKGTGAVTAVAHGRAAHAGNNHRDGANAIWALCRFIDRAQGLTDYDAGVTISVGKVSGGQSKNTVPDRAECALDLRYCTLKDGQGLMGRLREAAQAAAQSVPGTRIELAGGLARAPLERTEQSVRLLLAYGACARESGLGDSEADLVGGGSDASTAAALGIASIDGLGPRGRGFHTVDEQIEVHTLVQRAQALCRYLARAAGRGALV